MPLIEFTTIAALAGLILIIPIILLYLLKPKPKHVRFPTVMFILDTEKKRKFRTFLKKIFRDPLLIIQLLFISLLVLAAAGPYFFSTETENSKENAVIILDSSASMQATDMDGTRFSKSISLAKELINGLNDESKISIVLAESAPTILTKKTNKKNAEIIVSRAFVSDTPAKIEDSILFSKDLFSAEDENKKVYVFSDFAQAEPSDLKLAQRVLAQSNISVNYVKIMGAGNNIGIIDGKAKRFVTDKSRFYMTFTVKNYFDTPKEVSAKITLDGKNSTTMKREIAANSEQLFSFESRVDAADHKIEVSLEKSDSLGVDDKIFLYLPKIKKYNVLLITDEGEDTFTKYALQSSKDTQLRIAIPPVIPSFEGFDVVIFGNTNYNTLLPGTFLDTTEHVSNGSHAVFIASEGLVGENNAELDELLPVKIGSLKEKKSEVTLLFDPGIFKDIASSDAETIPDISVQRYIRCSNKTGASVPVTISEDDSPAIAYKNIGLGKIVYLGINPTANWSSIQYTAKFPIFWIQLLDWLTKDESTLGVTSFQTGGYLALSGDVEIITPAGQNIESGNMVFDEVGYYEIRRIDSIQGLTANLFSEEESDISKDTEVDTITDENLKIVKESHLMKKELIPYVLLSLFLLIVIEVYYYRRRGVI